MKAIYTCILVIFLTVVAAYFSFEQSRKFKQVQSDRLDYIDKNVGISNTIEVEKVELKESEEAYLAADKQRAELQVSVETRSDYSEKLNKQIASHKAILAQVEEQKTKLEAARKQLNEMLGGINVGGNINVNNLDTALTEVQDQKANRVAALDEIDLATAKTRSAIEANTAERSSLTMREEERRGKLQRSSLEAVITGVNQEWGFVIIGAGSNSGFTPQSGLLVQRDGRMIARVRPSSIEPTQTIAEINYKSLPPGVRIQPGDRVIFESPNVN